MRVRKIAYVVLLGLASIVPSSLVGAVEPGVDVGSKTSGIGTSEAAQPSPAPSIRVGPEGLQEGALKHDTPGKTGLGNTDRNAVGGAQTGPGVTPAPAGGAPEPARPGR